MDLSPEQHESRYEHGMPEGSTVTLGPAAASHARAAMQAWKRGCVNRITSRVIRLIRCLRWPRVSISVKQLSTRQQEEDLDDLADEPTPTSLQFKMAPATHVLSSG